MFSFLGMHFISNGISQEGEEAGTVEGKLLRRINELRTWKVVDIVLRNGKLLAHVVRENPAAVLQLELDREPTDETKGRGRGKR